MAPILVGVVVAAAVLDGAVSDGNTTDCARVAESLMRALHMAQFEKKPEGTVRSVFGDATTAQAHCASSESVAYLRLRAAELGKGLLIGDLTPAARAEWRRLADDEAVRFP